MARIICASVGEYVNTDEILKNVKKLPKSLAFAGKLY